MLLSKAIEYFIHYGEFSQSTQQDYRLRLNRFRKIVGDKEIEKISIEDIRQYRDCLSVSSRSIAHYLTVVRAFISFLKSEGFKVIESSRIKLPKFVKKHWEYISKEEVDKILKMMSEKNNLELRNKILVSMLFSTGCRISEILPIKIVDLELIQRKVLIQGKGDKIRWVFLDDRTVKLLKKYKSRKWLFPNLHQNGKGDSHIVRSRALSIIKMAAEKTGINKKIVCHSFRSGFATHLKKNGADIYDINALLGHGNNNIATTADYIRDTGVDQQKIYDKYHNAVRHYSFREIRNNKVWIELECRIGEAIIIKKAKKAIKKAIDEILG